MKRKAASLIFFFLILGYASADEDFYLLKAVSIRGNRITSEKYLESFITLRQGGEYSLETLLKEISVSKENLENTGLFSNIFFNDEIDENNQVVITIELREKNYFSFGPAGYLIYAGQKVRSDASLAFYYKNFMGNASRLDVELPVYENSGFLVLYSGHSKYLRYSFKTGYEYSHPEEKSAAVVSPAASYRVYKDIFSGLSISLNRYEQTSLLLKPFIERGRDERGSAKAKKWSYNFLQPYVGFNGDGSILYGLDANLNVYRDLLLQTVVSALLEINVQDGAVPGNLELRTNVRGYHHEQYRGSKRISLKGELHFPMPWNTRYVLAAFADSNLIGKTHMDFLIGGGLGLRWYARFFDPLSIDLAFGKGVMLNFQKRM